jgi:hypothetical protein
MGLWDLMKWLQNWACEQYGCEGMIMSAADACPYEEVRFP